MGMIDGSLPVGVATVLSSVGTLAKAFRPSSSQPLCVCRCGTQDY